MPPLFVVPKSFKKGLFTISLRVKEELMTNDVKGARYNNKDFSILVRSGSNIRIIKLYSSKNNGLNDFEGRRENPGK